MAAVTFVYAVGAVGVCHVESVHEDGECVFETQGSWQSALLAATHRAFSSSGESCCTCQRIASHI